MDLSFQFRGNAQFDDESYQHSPMGFQTDKSNDDRGLVASLNQNRHEIGDMGIAHIFNPGERHTLIGCLPFMPPEFHR